MPARAVSSPTAETRTRIAVSVATVPATTWAPGPRLTVVDSPVIIDSSIAAVPSITSPSAGTRPPGRTMTTSPTREVGRGDGLGGGGAGRARRNHPLGLVGQQRGQRVERRRRGRDRAHLDPVAEQHDHDQQRELPPEVELVVEQAEARAERREVGDGDREPDEQHHAGRAGLQLRPGAGEERAAAPEVHDRAEHGGDPRDQGVVGQRVADDRREHRAERDRRDRDDEHDPEQAPELADVVAVASVARVASVAGVRVVAGVRRRVVPGVHVVAGVHVVPGCPACRSCPACWWPE